MRPAASGRGVVPGDNFNELLADAVTLPEGVEVIPRPWSDIPSPHMTPEGMYSLSRDIDTALEQDDIVGAVVLHGTDTLVETAYMLDITLQSRKPVVITGAMRYLSESGYDGVRNMINGIRVCLEPLPADTGVSVLMTDRIFAARDVVKVNSLNVDAFAANEAGLLGYVAGDRILLSRHLCLHAQTRTPQSPEALELNVPIISCFTGMDSSLVDFVLDNGAKGFVVEGFGAGNVPPGIVPGIQRALDADIPVVLCTRCTEGGVWPVYGYEGGAADLQERGVIMGGRLNGVKARIQLMVALGVTTDITRIREYFHQDWL